MKSKALVRVRRGGFSLLELSLSMAVVTLLIAGLYWFFTALNVSVENSKKRADLVRLAEGIKKSAKLIVEVYTPYCTTGITNRNFGWGWRKSGCDTVRVFPVLNGNTLTFEFNESILSAADKNRLKSEIRSYFADFCVVDDSVANKITVTCSEFDGIYYCPATATDCNDSTQLVNSVHTPGNSYNYVNNRITSLVVEYTERGRRGVGGIQHRVGAANDFEKPAFLDFGDFYREMDQRNYKKFVDVYNALKRYEVTRRVTEMKNTAPAGLDELSDYFVPWVYQITASSSANAYAVCDDPTNSNCDNLHSNNYWNRTVGATDMYEFLHRIVDYLLGGDTSYFVDAWGNPIGVELLVNPNACRTLYKPGMASNCIRISNPPYPQKDYDTVFTTVRPPYLGYIYSEFCNDLDDASQTACRMPVVYAN